MGSARTLFDHIKGVTKNKTKWEDLSEEDQKSWSSYMVTRMLSMEPELLEHMNYFQQYSNEILPPDVYYKLLYDSLPEHSFFLKYIKKKQWAEIDPKFITLFCNHFQLGKRVVYDYLKFLKNTNPDELITILTYYGTDIKDIELFKKQMETLL